MPIEYATRASLLARAQNLTTLRKSEIIDEARKRTASGNTFLSHSSKDADILPSVIDILKKHGASVYVDKIDTSLPSTTSRETASILRKRVAGSKKFVLLASQNSKDSRWVPWELGLADGFKTPQNVAIFPSLENANNTAWTKQEYLGIYDRIVYGDHTQYQGKIWMVLNQENNTATELSRWLARS